MKLIFILLALLLFGCGSGGLLDSTSFCVTINKKEMTQGERTKYTFIIKAFPAWYGSIYNPFYFYGSDNAYHVGDTLFRIKP